MITYSESRVEPGTSGAPLIHAQGIVGLIIRDGGADAVAVDIAVVKRFVEQLYPWQLPECTDRGSVVTFRDKLKDGGEGPLMVNIPAGIFDMGDLHGGGDPVEKPVHTVRLDSFAVGLYEVTFEEYDQFAKKTNRDKPNDSGWGRGKHPVINVSWDDAIAYANWLSRQTGQLYRLPTEAEWEYVARAGTKTAYWWGNEFGDKWTNCDSYAKHTVPVGTFRPNRFGLHDTSGNVYEWVQDWYGPYSQSTASNPVGPVTGTRRVLRGGSWDNIAHHCRSALRIRYERKFSRHNVGFRLARTQH